ncbi:MAG: hypothetical protein GXY38_13345 [Planctomycetes bacterium]|jgi:hypothetical protein|nr:hypothetical protein [Planctomycetota bacterium]
MRRCMMGTCVLLFCAAAWSQETQKAATQSNLSEAIPLPVKWPLADAPKLPLREYTLEELAARFPAFKHEPFEDAGFNHLTLPFRYMSGEGDDVGHEAAAFSFLLSNALDWADGCYCATHAYFTFKRSRKIMAPMRRRYDRRIIAKQIEYWDATHAIGGLLRKTDAGYSGLLEVYDRSGRAILLQPYPRPRDYFELLGDMAADAMRILGYEPSDALVRHLKKKRCSDFKSIRDLGAAAFLEEKSDAEFAVYRRILQRDPGFAEVRYWYFNQKQWDDGIREDYILNMARALDDYLIEAALNDLSDEEASYPAFTEKFRKWVSHAQNLVGPANPSILHIKLHNKHVKYTDEDIGLMEKAAARYVHCRWLLVELGHIYYYNRDDPFMGASMYVAALRNKFLPSPGKKRNVELHLGQALCHLGLYQEGYSLIKPIWDEYFEKHSQGTAFNWLPLALQQTNHWAESVAQFNKIYKARQSKVDQHESILQHAGISAAVSGKVKVLDQILRDRREKLGISAVLLDAYADVSQGKSVDLNAIEKTFYRNTKWENSYPYRVFLAQMDLITHKSDYREVLEKTLCWDPLSRMLWFLFDSYDRQAPSPESASFYIALEWLYPQDEWVRQAAADYASRCASPVVADADELLAQFQKYETVRWGVSPDKRCMEEMHYFWSRKAPPFWVAAAIKGLIDRGQFDKAHELALRYHTIGLKAGCEAQVRLANWMIHLVELARDA